MKLFQNQGFILALIFIGISLAIVSVIGEYNSTLCITGGTITGLAIGWLIIIKLYK